MQLYVFVSCQQQKEFKMNRLSLLALLASLYCCAEFIKNPDANTLWIENGINIQTDSEKGGRQGWMNTKMDISWTPATEDSEAYFTFKSPENTKHYTRRYVPISKDYPWLVFEIVSYVPDAVNYKNCWGGFYKGRLFNINTPKPGIYLQDLWRTVPAEKVTNIFDFTLYGYEVNFKYIKVVKEPENRFQIDSPAFQERQYFTKGDKLIFTAKLAAPAEDVSISFYDLRGQRPVRINGNDSITLKPTNEETTEWRAECDIKNVSSKDKTFIFKCVVLGGKIKTPMWTNNIYPYDASKKEDK